MAGDFCFKDSAANFVFILEMTLGHTFLVAKLLYNLSVCPSVCLSVRPSVCLSVLIWGKLIFSAPIKDKRLKCFDNIPIVKEHN